MNYEEFVETIEKDAVVYVMPWKQLQQIISKVQ